MAGPVTESLPGLPPKGRNAGWWGCGIVVGLGIAFLGWTVYVNYQDMVIYDRRGDVLSDMRTLATALEAYAVDNGPKPFLSEGPALHDEPGGPYPPCASGAGGVNAWAMPKGPAGKISTFALRPGGGPYLTMPILYTAEIPRDRFSRGGKAYYGYYTAGTWWVLQSAGPDGVYDLPDLSRLPTTPEGQPDLDRIRPLVYDPTNGTQSGGDILSVSGVGPL